MHERTGRGILAGGGMICTAANSLLDPDEW